MAAAPVGSGHAWPVWSQQHKRRRREGHRKARQRFDEPTAPKQKSHVISLGHFSRPPENVAIPTFSIQCLKYLQGNYVRHCWGTTPVSHTEEATGVKGTGGPGCGARGRWRGLAGLRGDAPSEARGADGSRAGRRPRAQPAARPDSTPRGSTRNTAQGRGPVGPRPLDAAVRPHQLSQPSQTGSATASHRWHLRSACVPCRSVRATHRSRRSSRSPRLRRRAGPRR